MGHPARHHHRVRSDGCNPCCCWNVKDGAITIGIWTAVYSICQLGLMGWQMAAIKYERDRAANTLLPNYNTYGRYDVPSYYESYWQSPEERYYTGLFIIQVLCLIAAFFLLFASVALIYGVHSYSRYLIWPWFPCQIASILSCTAYCIMWWAGDVRDYWIALTILEAIGVFINTYCTVVVIVFYRRLQAETDFYEGKARPTTAVRYQVYRNTPGSPRASGRRPNRNPSPPPAFDWPHHNPMHDLERNYYGAGQAAPRWPGQPDVPLPMPSGNPNRPPSPPYPTTFAAEPKRRIPNENHQGNESSSIDFVSSWVRDQQKQVLLPEHAASEPPPPLKSVTAAPPIPKKHRLQHSRSVPSLHAESSVSQRGDRKHRHHSREEDDEDRRRKRHRSGDDTTRHSGRRRRHSDRRKHRDDYTETAVTSSGVYSDRHRPHRRHHRSSSRRRRDASTGSSSYSSDSGSSASYSDSLDYRSELALQPNRSRGHSGGSRHRRHGSRSSRHRRRDDEDEDGGRRARTSDDSYTQRTAVSAPIYGHEDDHHRRHHRNHHHHHHHRQPAPVAPQTRKSREEPLATALHIPQHIFLPARSGGDLPLGADGRPEPQKVNINSEIVISYDERGRPRASTTTVAPPPPDNSLHHHHPLQPQQHQPITSNV